MNLELINIKKNFGEKEVLKGISFSASGGKAFGLLGRNGAGKTTTLRILMNVFPPDEGQVLLDGAPLSSQSIGLGYLPEERGLYPKKKIIDQLVYFSELKGMPRREAVKSIDYWLNRLEMTEYRSKLLNTLSKGNQQKIQLITAVAHDPQIVILDEPFSGLDPVNAMLLKSVVREEIDRGKVVIFSSHQMNYIEEFCDEIAILNDGRIVLSGDLRAIKKSYPRDRLIVHSPECDKILSDYSNCCLSTGTDEVEISLSQASDKASVMSNLTLNYDIDEVKVAEPTLGEIFVEYTKSDMISEEDS